MDDRFFTIDARLSAYRFLLGQLYCRLFLADQDLREHLPAELIDAAMFRATSAPGLPDDEALELKTRVVLELKRFFVDVEARTAQAAGRRSQ